MSDIEDAEVRLMFQKLKDNDPDAHYAALERLKGIRKTIHKHIGEGTVSKAEIKALPRLRIGIHIMETL